MKALTAAEMREVDRLTTTRFGISSLQLMEAAGKRVADAVRGGLAAADSGRIAVLCGKGNNGGDGFVAARLLKETSCDVVVFLFGTRDQVQGDAASNLERWLKTSGELHEVGDAASFDQVWSKISACRVIVDALLGTGLRGPASGVIAHAIAKLNQWSQHATLARPAMILAVDIPSGLPSDGQSAEGPVLSAHRTITFTAPKIGQLISPDAAKCGQLAVAQIGSPAELVEEIGRGDLHWAEPEEFAAMPLVRAADSNKGTFGHVLLVAGSIGKSGAAILAGRAALRAGAGLVTIATPDSVHEIVAMGEAEFMTAPLAATKAGTLSLRSFTDKTFATLKEGKNVLGIGPGLGSSRQTHDFIRAVVAETELPVVLDADGLNAFAGDALKLRKRKTKFLALTPHPGEMARLLGVSTKAVQADRLNVARGCAQKWNAYIVLKGFHTITASPNGELFINTTGNAGLAKGGTGDVLTGVLTALTSQFGTTDWLRVLTLGVYLHGAAAELAGSADLSGLLAHEVANHIPIARAKLVRDLNRA